jgi:glutathione S-transferase
VEDHLAKNMWFAGDEISGADFAMSFPVECFVANYKGVTENLS